MGHVVPCAAVAQCENGKGRMKGNQPATPRGCRWCGRPLDGTHAAGDCLQSLDRALDDSLKASRKRERNIKARIRALDGFMDRGAPKILR